MSNKTMFFTTKYKIINVKSPEKFMLIGTFGRNFLNLSGSSGHGFKNSLYLDPEVVYRNICIGKNNFRHFSSLLLLPFNYNYYKNINQILNFLPGIFRWNFFNIAGEFSLDLNIFNIHSFIQRRYGFHRNYLSKF